MIGLGRGDGQAAGEPVGSARAGAVSSGPGRRCGSRRPDRRGRRTLTAARRPLRHGLGGAAWSRPRSKRAGRRLAAHLGGRRSLGGATGGRRAWSRPPGARFGPTGRSIAGAGSGSRPGVGDHGSPPRGGPRASRSRCPQTSKRRIEPATAALSDPIAPRIGIRTNRSQRRRTAGPRPWPSLPTTIASGPRRSAWRAVSGASASAPTIRRPRTWRSARAPGRSSTGASRRCSTAPAEALTAAGLSGAWRFGREEDAVDAGRLGAPEQRADVLGILERVEDEDERAARRARSPGRGCRRGWRTAAARRRGRCPGGRRSRRAPSASRPRPRRSGCGGSSREGRCARAPAGAAA